jgi:hypothetical protein
MLGSKYGMRPNNNCILLRDVWPKRPKQSLQNHQYNIELWSEENLLVSNAENERSGAIRRCHVKTAGDAVSFVPTIRLSLTYENGSQILKINLRISIYVEVFIGCKIVSRQGGF